MIDLYCPAKTSSRILLSLVLLLMPACGTFEVDIIPPATAVTTATVTVPSKTVAPTATPVTAPPTQPPSDDASTPTPSPYIDHWTSSAFPAYGVVLERPADWQAAAGYGDPQTGETRFAGINGFVHIAAMGADSLDQAVEAEAGHHLQPYGAQPVVENIQIQGQPARLILPSDDQSPGFSRQAAVIARYPQPIDIDGQTYPFFVLWADREHIRAIAQTVQFTDSVSSGDTPTPSPVASWSRLPPGLIYSTFEGLWLIGADENPSQIYNQPQAIPSSDGRRLISYDAIQQDAWLIDRAAGTVLDLTRTPNRLECCFQWWPQQPGQILFGATEANPPQDPAAIRYYLTLQGLDGKGYQVLDPDHPLNVSGAQGAIALAPDGQTVAYGAGSTGWLYRHPSQEIEPFDPQDYGLSAGEPLHIAQPAWSPQGTRLAWIVKGNVAADGSSDWTGVAVFDQAARTAQILHQYPSQGVGWPAAPAWSPDGRWLAFGDSSPSERAGLWVAQLDTAASHHLGPGGNPIWNPDGRWLAFQSMAGGIPGYAIAEAGVWQPELLDLPVDRLGQLVAWVPLESEAGSERTIDGAVSDVSPSARIIALTEPVDGIRTIALTGESDLARADGTPILLRDLWPGAAIRATGQPDASGALVARQVTVLDPAPTPQVLAPSPTATPAPAPIQETRYLGLNQVQGLAFASLDRLWAATTGGAARWDLETGNHVQYTAADGLADNRVTGVAQAPDGTAPHAQGCGPARIHDDPSRRALDLSPPVGCRVGVGLSGRNAHRRTAPRVGR